jgi:hypothetical protein
MLLLTCPTQTRVPLCVCLTRTPRAVSSLDLPPQWPIHSPHLRGRPVAALRRSALRPRQPARPMPHHTALAPHSSRLPRMTPTSISLSLLTSCLTLVFGSISPSRARPPGGSRLVGPPSLNMTRLPPFALTAPVSARAPALVSLEAKVPLRSRSILMHFV